MGLLAGRFVTVTLSGASTGATCLQGEDICVDGGYTSH